MYECKKGVWYRDWSPARFWLPKANNYMHLWCELFPWLKGRGRIEACWSEFNIVFFAEFPWLKGRGRIEATSLECTSP